MARLIQYRHHGVLVKVDKDLKGTVHTTFSTPVM
jgi:hypothetical protein